MSVDMQFSQVNRSPTKMTFSFPKAQRMPRLQPPYCQNIYAQPSTLTKRAASIGMGKRNRINSQQSPAPGDYQQVSGTISQDLKYKGFTMGISRERAVASGIGSVRNISPGPGSFLPKSELSQIAFSIPSKPRTGGIADILARNGVPGPGKYLNQAGLNPIGKYPISNLRNTSSIVFNKQSGSRFERILTEYVPGPGTYDVLGVSSSGKYNLSKITNPRTTTIPKASDRLSKMARSISLGPGSYDIPSEFGKLPENLGRSSKRI